MNNIKKKKNVGIREDIVWNAYEKYVKQCIERGGNDTTVCLTVT
jgi:hypothetical protein